MESPYPEYRPMSCEEETPEYINSRDAVPSEEFWMGLFDFEKEKIEEYPYGSDIFDKDCASFEYPDPKDPRYAQPFIENKIVPIIIAAPPSKEIYIDDTNYLSGIDFHALRMSANNCPGLKYDPWSAHMCSQRPDYCYRPDSYPELFPYVDEDNLWISEKCRTEECAQAWWDSCMELEYQSPLNKMIEHGAITHYENMSALHNADSMLQIFGKAIKSVLEERFEIPGCDPLYTTTTKAGSIIEYPTDPMPVITFSTDPMPERPVPDVATTEEVVTTTTEKEVPTTTTTEGVVTTTTEKEVPTTTTTKKEVPTTTTTEGVVTTTTKKEVPTTTTTEKEVPTTTTEGVVTTTTKKEVPTMTTN